MRTAIQQAAEWANAGQTLRMSFNVSALQFQQSNFVDSVAQALADAKLPPEMIELELTESVLIRDAEIFERLEQVDTVVFDKTGTLTEGRPKLLALLVDDGEDDAEGADIALGEDGEESADLYDKAVAVVLRDRKASTSYIQRRLQIGYNRAASIMERMEQEGVVGQANHAGKREILIGQEEHQRY